VPYDTIVEDYLLTNTAGDFEQFILTQHNAQMGLAVNAHPLMELPSDVRKVLFAADAEYLHSAFEQIDAQHGGVEAFLDVVVGITQDKRERIKEKLLL
jgi:protein-tyrosine phosphatase